MPSCATPVRFVGGPEHNKVRWTNLQAWWKVRVKDDCYLFNDDVIPKDTSHFEYYKLVVGRTEYGTQYYEYHHEKYEEPDSAWSVSDEAVELLPALFYFDESWIERFAKKGPR